MPRVILGTASFASGYGISNPKSEADQKRAQKLIIAAQQLGITDFDTAPVYGIAEELLGKHLDKNRPNRVSTKLSAYDCGSLDLIEESIKKSLERLQIDQIEILYLHDENVLFESKNTNLLQNLQHLKQVGYFTKLGISVYTLESLQNVHSKFPEIEVYQVPENICDRRISDSEFVKQICTSGSEIIVRSIFMQGLLLMDPLDIQGPLIDAIPSINSLIAFSAQNEMSRMEMCLAYAKSLHWCSGIILGVYDFQQLVDLVSADRSLPIGWEQLIEKLPINCLDPRRW
jgi:aryl-alcohol dehydrogenase-like predicted oxidoreductase